jgi:hypothetical protein
MNPVGRNEFERKCHKCCHTATIRGGQKIHETMTATRNTTGGNIVYQGNKHHHSNRGWISHQGFINESTRISAVDGALWPIPQGGELIHTWARDNSWDRLGWKRSSDIVWCLVIYFWNVPQRFEPYPRKEMMMRKRLWVWMSMRDTAADADVYQFQRFKGRRGVADCAR